jgi:hypothetical protein
MRWCGSGPQLAERALLLLGGKFQGDPQRGPREDDAEEHQQRRRNATTMIHAFSLAKALGAGLDRFVLFFRRAGSGRMYGPGGRRGLG